MHQETLLCISSRDFYCGNSEEWTRINPVLISATCRFSVDLHSLDSSIDIVERPGLFRQL